MKPINAEEIVRVFNGWLEEADSLAEREAIECCIDHIQDAPAVSQQELRSYMLPWFSPFAAPWCGKIQRAFPKAYVTMNFELILVPRTEDEHIHQPQPLQHPGRVQGGGHRGCIAVCVQGVHKAAVQGASRRHQ